MQLDQLQQQWQSLDKKLDQAVKLNGELLRLAVVPPARGRIQRAAFWPTVDVACCLGVLLLTGFFLGHHWNTLALVGPAGVVMAAAILLLIDSIRQHNLVSEIDWSGTVVDIQSSLARLSMLKIRQFKWVILSSPLVWFCGLIVGLQWLLDLGPVPHYILDKLPPAWVAGNYVFGVLFIFFGHAAIRFLAKRFGGRGWWQRSSTTSPELA